MRDFVTVVTGMPRSGTSLMMRMLDLGGIQALTDGLRAADEHNPHGYYEFEPVKRLDRDSSWVAGAKGKAVKVIYRLLPLLPAAVDYRFLFMERDLREIFASQRTMLRAKDDEAAGQKEALLIPALARELEQTRMYLKTRHCLVVPYQALLTTPREWTGRIAEFLGGDLDEAAMIATIDPTLYRHRSV